ncbi:Chloroperoxidase [Aspergillus lucknowensis]|uniref:Chloroperoxidase n=1 Tax=Aspergillus lucknowensis TaxID=176173 RepID=A0ABR4LSK2_9EURO
MNTLANHGFLPHDGRKLTRPVVVDALNNALNSNTSLANLMFDMAIVVNPEENATYFTLDQLNRHSVLEHHASLSLPAVRTPTSAQTTSSTPQLHADWTDLDTLTAAMLANGKIARQVVSKAFDPTYSFIDTAEPFSLGANSQGLCDDQAGGEPDH